MSSFLSRLRGAGAAAGGLRLRGAAGVGASLSVRGGAGSALAAFGAALVFGLLRLGGGATGVDASLPRLRCGGGDDLAALAGRALSCLAALLGLSGSCAAVIAGGACCSFKACDCKPEARHAPETT